MLQPHERRGEAACRQTLNYGEGLVWSQVEATVIEGPGQAVETRGGEGVQVGEGHGLRVVNLEHAWEEQRFAQLGGELDRPLWFGHASVVALRVASSNRSRVGFFAAPGAGDRAEDGPIEMSVTEGAPEKEQGTDRVPEEIASESASVRRGRLLSLASIGIFDVGAPLVIYSLLRSSGWSQVHALVLSGVAPAAGVVIGYVRHRRVDAVGVLVLLGIVVGTVVGLVTGNARLLLVEGSVPTGIFGIVCVASLWSSRPLMYRFALEFMGPGTAKGRDFESRWRYEGFRHAFRVITVVWGVAYLAEAVARVIIVETTSTGRAFAISKVMPYAVAGVIVIWMTFYGRRAKRRGERQAALAQARDEETRAAIRTEGYAEAPPAIPAQGSEEAPPSPW